MHTVLDNVDIQLRQVHISLPLVPIKITLSKAALLEHSFFIKRAAYTPKQTAFNLAFKPIRIDCNTDVRTYRELVDLYITASGALNIGYASCKRLDCVDLPRQLPQSLARYCASLVAIHS